MIRLLLRPAATFALAACMGATGLSPAAARPQPTPPPSGIVVHLFGPQSLSSQILPGGAAPDSSPEPSSGQSSSESSGESWGAVAHQMFVVGDPAQEGRAALPKGRAGK
ncbi:hypothetical protein [Acidocella sp.]|uniref:hypothetical protein n=1 Tax=Acidocella sp. TaxID=50710 RepID=UPI00260E3286|nr:hypothetical protein [Acidocella sp.]